MTKNLKSSYFSFALSATPFRDEGDDLIIQGCFGKKVCEVTASELIQKGWLVKPEIKIIHIKEKKSKYRGWQEIYKDQVTENMHYNSMIANIANDFVENGRIVLILVQQIKHGKLLESIIPDSLFVSGSSSKKKRQQAINDLRDKKIRCLLASIIFDEGIDVRALDTLILAGHGKSKVRALQRIGRTLRPYTDPKTGKKKEGSVIVDFRLHQKFLKKHSEAREKMFRTESEFDIEHIEA